MDGNGADHQTEHVHDFVQRPEPVDAVTPEPRNYAGWVVLFCLFSFLIGMGLLGTFLADKKSSQSDLNNSEFALRIALRQKQLFSFISSQNSKEVDGAIDTVADDLSEQALKDVAAAKLYVVALGEAKKKPGPKYFAVLLNGGTVQDRALARLYATETLSRGAAERLLTDLQGDSFALQLARVHARERAGIKPSGRDEIAPMWKAVGLVFIVVGALLVLALSVIVWAVFLSMRASGQIKPLGLPTGPISLLGADRLAMLAGTTLAVFLVLGMMSESLAESLPSVPRAVFNLVAPIGILVFLLVIQKVPIFGKPVRLSELGVNKERFGKNLAWGFAGYAAELPLMAVMGIIGQKVFSFLPPPQHPASTVLQNSPDLVVVLSILIFGAMIAPFWEEIAFRGMMFPAFARLGRGRVVAASLVTSFLFAAIHPQGISTWPALMTVAVASCTLAYYTRSLVPSIVMHALHNGTLLIVTLVIF